MTRALPLLVVIALLAAACSPSLQDVPSATVSPSASVAATRYSLGHFPEPPTGPFSDETARALQAIVDAAVDQGLPGLSATVIAADAGAWTGVAGTADGEHPLEADSQFAIASITKTVIAAEVMHLSKEGLLRLGDQVSRHLPKELRFHSTKYLAAHG